MVAKAKLFGGMGKPCLVKTASFSTEPLKTCPWAGECKTYCYGCKGNFRKYWRSMLRVWQRNFEALLAGDFVERSVAELLARRSLKALRWNREGDTFNRAYRDKVIEVARRTPQVQHYLYTKSVKLWKSAGTLPTNLTVIYSLGGRQDGMIDLTRDRHARIFEDRRSAERHGYCICDTDETAWRTATNKIGLIAH